MELYDINPPPGNSGGAVSGAGPCPLAVAAQNNKTSASRKPRLHPMDLPNVTRFSSSKDNDSKHTNARSRETTGGQTRFEEARTPGSRRWAGRGIARRGCEPRNLSQRPRSTPAQARIRRGQRTRRDQAKAAQKSRASLAWSCSNPDPGDGATSNAPIYSTASPVPASSRHYSRIHTLREQLPARPERFVQSGALSISVDAHGVRVKRVGAQRISMILGTSIG